MHIGATIHCITTCPSTNELARRLAQQGAQEGTVVIAEEQTEGRGTKGRSWHSPRGQGVYASVILRPRRSDLSLLPVIAAVACAEAIREAAGIEPRLKWPNDIVWKGEKLGGVLCESGFLGNAASYAILGIGLNVDQKRSDFPEELRPTATSLRLALGRKADRASLERSLWPSLDRWYRLFSRGKKAEIVRAFESHLIFPTGKIIRVTTEKTTITGVFRGIDPQARLILEPGGRPQIFSPAEILRIDYNE